MPINLRFELDFQTPFNGGDGWRTAQYSSTPSADIDDPFDIGEGSRPHKKAAPHDQDSGQTANDVPALTNFITMLMAILDQFLNARLADGFKPEQKGGTGPGSAQNRRTDMNNEDGSADNRFTPPIFVVKSTEPGDIANREDGTPQVPTGNQPPKAQGQPATAKEGVSPGSTQLVSTGTGTGHHFNVTNNTDREQTFAFSSNSSNTSGYSNNINAVMTLKPGETGTFEAGDNVPGIRINTSGANGQAHGNETLYEDTIEPNPMGGGIVHNPDVSNVDGKLSYDGRPQRMTVSDGSRSIGDGTETGVYDYDIEDKDPNRATNPMNMALNPAVSYSIVFSDG